MAPEAKDRRGAGPFCTSYGHHLLPAAAVGIYDDGEVAHPDVAYCASCAQAMLATRDYTVTEVLNPFALGTIPCSDCGGSGRLWQDTGRPVHADAAPSPVEADIAELIAAFDDTPPEGLTALFYAHAYWELRFAVDALLADRPRARASGEPDEGDAP